MSADEEHVTTDAQLVEVQRLMRGRRSVGVDLTDGIETTVTMIAWPDGTYTVADVQRRAHPQTHEQAEALYQRTREAIERGELP